MPCGWGGNLRSGVALAMRHRLQWLRMGDKHPVYTPQTGWLVGLSLNGAFNRYKGHVVPPVK